MSNKEIALSYRSKGLSIIPIWSLKQIERKPPSYFIREFNNALEKNKKKENPLSDDEVYQDYVTRVCKRAIINWTPFQKRLPTEQEVSTWFDKWPDANIGIVTGKISGIVVFDLDSDHAVQYAEDEGGFPDTPMVKTGKGSHAYVQHPGFEIRNDVNKKLDIDIRADGGYVAAPPSIHGSGNHYKWEDCSSILDIEPAPCEPWMIDYLKDITKNSSKSVKKEPPKPSKSADTASKSKAQGDYADILINGAVEGMRNHTATRLVGHLFKKGIPGDEVWTIVRLWNSTKNTPPLDESELRRTFDSVKKMEAKKEKPKIDIRDLLDDPKKILKDHDEHYVVIPFGGDNLNHLESKLGGGLLGGRIYFLGGIPSSSKTALLNNIADNICLSGYPVLFFSYDDGRSELRHRTFSRFSSSCIEQFNRNILTRDETETICENDKIKIIMGLKYVAEQMITVEKWGGMIEDIQTCCNKAPVIMIDYLRKLRTEDRRGDERLRVDDIISMLTEMAKKYNTPVMVISELARDSYKLGQRLGMASLKESGSIEYEASWLGILAAVEDEGGVYKLKDDWEKIIDHDGNVDLIVFKAKRGTGVTGKIPLKVDKDRMTVKDRVDPSRSKYNSATVITPQSKLFGGRGM